VTVDKNQRGLRKEPLGVGPGGKEERSRTRPTVSRLLRFRGEGTAITLAEKESGKAVCGDLSPKTPVLARIDGRPPLSKPDSL